jgi:hypothetical protein
MQGSSRIASGASDLGELSDLMGPHSRHGLPGDSRSDGLGTEAWVLMAWDLMVPVPSATSSGARRQDNLGIMQTRRVVFVW